MEWLGVVCLVRLQSEWLHLDSRSAADIHRAWLVIMSTSKVLKLLENPHAAIEGLQSRLILDTDPVTATQQRHSAIQALTRDCFLKARVSSQSYRGEQDFMIIVADRPSPPIMLYGMRSDPSHWCSIAETHSREIARLQPADIWRLYQG